MLPKRTFANVVNRGGFAAAAAGVELLRVWSCPTVGAGAGGGGGCGPGIVMMMMCRPPRAGGEGVRMRTAAYCTVRVSAGRGWRHHHPRRLFHNTGLGQRNLLLILVVKKNSPVRKSYKKLLKRKNLLLHKATA